MLRDKDAEERLRWRQQVNYLTTDSGLFYMSAYLIACLKEENIKKSWNENLTIKNIMLIYRFHDQDFIF